jgi:hypothetical protein
MNVVAPDLSTTVPRSGREMLGRYSWLARLADKVRSDHTGIAGEYIAYCGLSTGFLDRAGVSVDDFDKLIRDGASEAANRFVLDDMKSHLDEQDAEEGH